MLSDETKETRGACCVNERLSSLVKELAGHSTSQMFPRVSRMMVLKLQGACNRSKVLLKMQAAGLSLQGQWLWEGVELGSGPAPSQTHQGYGC